jgi:hypothetical protein
MLMKPKKKYALSWGNSVSVLAYERLEVDKKNSF